MSTKPQNTDPEGDDLTDHNDVEGALNDAQAECAHISTRTFFQGMGELIGEFVRRGELTRSEVFQYLDAAMPPEPPPEDINWRDL